MAFALAIIEKATIQTVRLQRHNTKDGWRLQCSADAPSVEDMLWMRVNHRKVRGLPIRSIGDDTPITANSRPNLATLMTIFQSLNTLAYLLEWNQSAHQFAMLYYHLTNQAGIDEGWVYSNGMKSLTEHLWFEVPGRRGFVNITGTVENLVHKSGVQEGLCLVNAMHITASVFINDSENGLLHDYEVWLEKLAPHAPVSDYHHNRTGEDNADAHMKRQIMGREVVVAVTKGQLDFGPWEQIFYGEFDGNRRKRVLVKIIGE